MFAQIIMWRNNQDFPFYWLILLRWHLHSQTLVFYFNYKVFFSAVYSLCTLTSQKNFSSEYLITFYTWKIVSTHRECSCIVRCCGNYFTFSFFPVLLLSKLFHCFCHSSFCSELFFSIWSVLSSSYYHYIIKDNNLAMDKNLCAMRKWVCCFVV